LTEAQQSPRRAVHEQPSPFYAQDGPRPGRARRAQVRPRSSRLCCAAEREPTRPLPLPPRRQLVARQTYELEEKTTSAERWRERYSACEAQRLAIGARDGVVRLGRAGGPPEGCLAPSTICRHPASPAQLTLDFSFLASMRRVQLEGRGLDAEGRSRSDPAGSSDGLSRVCRPSPRLH